MRIAFFADIHGNLEALEACFKDASERSAGGFVFLGDIVGYGADPGRCVDKVADACAGGAVAVIGNHDEAVSGTRFKLNEAAAAAMHWTQSALSPEQKRFLAGLPMQIEDAGRLYVHASADTPAAYRYVRSLVEARESLEATHARLTFVGHVHAPALYNVSSIGKVMGFIPITDMPIPLPTQRRWLAVMGAVGQPRDGNPAAAYGLLDTATNELSYVRVPYDVEGAAAKIRAAGLPESLWKRLGAGR